MPADLILKYGDNYVYSCEHGYMTEDYVAITCQADGMFSMPNAPTCEGKC